MIETQARFFTHWDSAVGRSDLRRRFQGEMLDQIEHSVEESSSYIEKG